ncbi:MAG: Spy/CpxP family protein refolding chaperone [Bacteroidales bacterium]|jgi:Spy/CpxP family protein refolding chaperone|nr:Spy/CpxP family protein refolding chaperone [Bacteroidales bacterium]
MKTKKMKKITVLAVVFLMLAGTQGFAQRGRNYRSMIDRPDRNDQTCWRIPDLTADQETQIEALRVDHWREMNNYRNQMNELRARKRTLNTTDQTDIKEINSVIDQMTGVHNKMMKASAKHRQEVRNLLTDEQKVYFDSMPARGRGYNRGAGRTGAGYRNARGMGQGYGAGYGYGYPYSDSQSDEE